MVTQKCIGYTINGSTYRTEPLCAPWEIERRLQSLLSSYGVSWFKSNVKMVNIK